jgi:hypothetical protein
MLASDASLSQATDHVALLPDLSGTAIESNAVVFDGAGAFLSPRTSLTGIHFVRYLCRLG